ncbi:MAG: hypothetical protein ACQESR_27070 [Planctomycetota bacterium]
MESCPTQAVLPLVGLAAEKVIRDPYIPTSSPRPTTSGIFLTDHNRIIRSLAWRPWVTNRLKCSPGNSAATRKIPRRRNRLSESSDFNNVDSCFG